MKQSLIDVHRILTPGGQLFLTAFGPSTLRELFLSMGEDFKSTLPSKEDFTNAILECGFLDFDIQNEIVKATFSDVLTLLRWLKAIGANTASREILLNKGLLKKIDEFYKTNFNASGKIYASFEVVSVGARKRFLKTGFTDLTPL